MENNTIKSLSTFYSDCVVDYHTEAAKMGVATKGTIFIPELIPYGERILLTFLRDPVIEMEFSDPRTYYYAIMSFGIQSGIVFAAKWHEDFSGLDEQFDMVSALGPSFYANDLLEKHFPSDISRDQGNTFYYMIFERLEEEHKPYWQLRDPRQYTFKALLAAYQLGVSMMLEKLGY